MHFELLICATVIVYLIILVKVLQVCYEGFEDKKAQIIYENKEMFNPSKGSYRSAKSKMNWLDPVLYYDASQLSKKNILTVDNLKKTLV
jgi:hypothetical protein